VSQLAIAWSLKNKNVSSVILGASNPSQLEHNVKALQVVPKLTEEICNKIEEVLKTKPKVEVISEWSKFVQATKK